MTTTATKQPTGFNERRLRSNLLRSQPAMAALAAAGIERSDVETLGLGMKEPYSRADGVEVSGVVTYPIEEQGGRRRYGYINLPGVTLSPNHGVAWSPGNPKSLLIGEGGVLLVVGSPLTAFQVRGSSQRRMLAIAVVASSDPDRLPTDWASPAFWGKWDRVILCDEVPTAVTTQIALSARRPLEQAVGAVRTASANRLANNCIDDWVDAVLTLAAPYAGRSVAVASEDQKPGDFAAEPVPLHGAFAKGWLYYPFMVERRQPAGPGRSRLLHSYETLVLRSDGAILEAVTLPAPPGSSASQRVHSLTDGTRIVGAPTPSRNSTWSLAGIQAFAAARADGRDPCQRSPALVVSDVRRFIASKVVLPKDDDYWVSAIFVMMTHIYRVFQALPILLVKGPRGTGKTELAAAMAAVGFNSAVMGQGSASALVRLARECGGLIVLDDAEGLAGGGFSDLGQCLKVGYRAATARKPITLSSGRVDVFDFFGPRVVTCTRGVDNVLASRCIAIRTAMAAASEGGACSEPDYLRDELHSIAMVRAHEIQKEYAGIMSGASERSDEIWAPLFAIAAALGCGDAEVALGRARRRAEHAGLLRDQ